MSINAQRSNVVELHNADGSISRYKRFSARLPDFLERYPADKGWRVERLANHAMSTCPDLVKLHMAAVSVGKAPKDLGLPALPTGMLFECRLISPEGVIVMTATCRVTTGDVNEAGMGAGNKDWEAGETNAFQRLVASLGFDGNMLDDDESNRQRQIGTKTQGAAPVTVIEPVDSVDESKSEGAAVATTLSHKDVVDEPPVKVRGARAPQEATLLKGLQRQIDMLARQRKREAPVATSITEAKQILANLMDSPATST